MTRWGGVVVNNGSVCIAAKARTGFCLLYERKNYI